MDVTALFDISYGLYIIGAERDGKLNGQIANTVVQITSKPAAVAVSLSRENLTNQMIAESGRFSVCTLTTDMPMKEIGLFGFKSGRTVDKFAQTPHFLAPSGAPVVKEHCCSWLDCKLQNRLDVGTHTIFVALVTDAGRMSHAEPLTYAYYHRVKKGLAPKNAPTYLNGRADGPKAPAGSYRCPVCGYVYDPAAGDPAHGVAPGTPFEALPAGWKCPLCSTPAGSFARVGT